MRITSHDRNILFAGRPTEIIAFSFVGFVWPTCNLHNQATRNTSHGRDISFADWPHRDPLQLFLIGPRYRVPPKSGVGCQDRTKTRIRSLALGALSSVAT